MDSSDNKYLKKTLGKVIMVILYILRWLTLCMSVIVIGFTIGLIIMTFVNGTETSTNLVAKMMALLTYYSQSEIIDYILSIGKTKVVVAGIGYGLAYSIRYFMEYVIVSNLIKIYYAILKENVYTEECVKIINRTLPITFIATFLNPVMINIVNIGTTLFNEYDYNVSPIVYICIVYVLKLIIEKGYTINETNISYKKEVSEHRRNESELKMELISQKEELEDLRKYKKVVEDKKALERKQKRMATKKAKEEIIKEEKTTSKKKTTTTKRTTKK